MVIAHHDYGPKSVLTSEICGEKIISTRLLSERGKRMLLTVVLADGAGCSDIIFHYTLASDCQAQ